jgi:tetratricopeptide (TPR) repeat protein
MAAMTLSRRIAFVRGAFWPTVCGVMTVIAVVAIALVPEPGLGTFVAIVGAALTVTVSARPITRALYQRLALQHQARMDAAIADGDDATRRRLLDETDEYYRLYVRNSERMRLRLRASGLVSEERYAEALALAGELDVDKLPAGERPAHANLVAWCCAHAGETARAVELARATAAAPAPPRLKPYLLGTLGAALVLDRQPAAAVAPLREALALGGPRSAQVVRRLYLGDALAALGRLDEARAEWNEAVTIASKSRWGRRAQERLAAPVPAAYR